MFAYVDSWGDPSLFIYSSDGVRVFLFVYVDGIVMTRSDDNMVRTILDKLGGEFACEN